MSVVSRPGSTGDPLWYKDAIIYELHVKTFFDRTATALATFAGLIEKLDYLARPRRHVPVAAAVLRVSAARRRVRHRPLRADASAVRHAGRLRRFLDAAHARGLRVITELVINHTSDQHPWFQAARRAPAGSSKRDFYVWSDTDQRYPDARVIFHDVEPSNWTLGSDGRAFYWHRFFRHQPDLNFDNPRVRRAVMKVMRFWLDMGVDGLRLDAVAHLFEREGTTCDNLPETHAFLKRSARDMDRRYTRPHAAGRGQPVAGRCAPVLRRRR